MTPPKMHSVQQLICMKARGRPTMDCGTASVSGQPRSVQMLVHCPSVYIVVHGGCQESCDGVPPGDDDSGVLNLI